MKAPGPEVRNLESATLLSKVAMFIIGCRQIRAAVSATHDHRRIARGGSNTIRSSSSLNMSPVCACKPGARGPFVQGTSHRPFPAMACGRNPSARVVAAYAGLCALQSACWHPREQYVRKRTAWHRHPLTLLASPYNAHPAAAAAAQPARSAPSRLEDKLRGTSKSHIPTAEENICHHSKHNPIELRYYVP